MDYQNCNICKSQLIYYTDIQGEISNKRIHILQCSNCKMLFSKVPSNKIDDSTFSHNTFNGYIDSKEYSLKRVNKLLTYLESSYINKKKQSILLDIGCGAGWSLVAAESMDYECYGVEPMVEASKYANDKLNLNVINSKYNSNLIKKHADIIILDQVVEHVSSPLDFLEDVAKVLRPGGIFFIAVPPNDWLRRMLSLSIQVPLKVMTAIHNKYSSFFKKLIEIDLYKVPEGHINVFTEKSMKLIAKNLNLEYCSQYHSSKLRSLFNKIFRLSSGSYILKKGL